MKKRLFITMCMVFFVCVSTWSQSATLIRNSQPVAAFSGPDALKLAITSAQASGDVIKLSSGTYNNPGEITKSVSIYGSGWENEATRSFIRSKLCFRSAGEGSLDGIHLEGLYIEQHIDLLNDNNRNPMNNFTVDKIRCQGFYFYMPTNDVSIKQCLVQGTIRCYNGTFTTTNFVLENCWKEGPFCTFSSESTITVRNSILRYYYISGDANTFDAKVSYENSIIGSATIGGGSSLTNCALIGCSLQTGTTTTDCWTGLSNEDVFSESGVTTTYSAGTIATVNSTYVGTDGTAIGITGGTLGWNTTPSQPTMNFETTLVKDADGYYKIGTAADWIELKRVVENIEPMANAKMTADIDLVEAQAMIGNGHYNTATFRRAFCGIFDGQGHTLTINFVTADILQSLKDQGFTEPSYLGCAPFGFVCGGTIRNLNTAGTITSTHEGVAGIVGWTDGSTLIENCHSSVNLEITNGYRGVAGIIYNTLGNGELTIRDCIYDGTLTAGSNKTGAAGFFVMRGSGKANVFNSLLLATYANGLGTGDCATFVRNGLGGGIITNSFYKTVLGEAQGVQATETELANGRTAFYLQAGRSDLVWGQEIGVDPLPILTNDESKRVYRSANGYTNDPSLAIANQDLVPLTYTRNSDNELTITGFDQGFTPPADYDLIIPDEIDGAPVVAIANSAFISNTKIRSVTANSVTVVGQNAFDSNSSLVSITMNEVLTLQRAAFDRCGSLTTINMPKVETIADIVFGTASSLTEVSLPKAKTLGVEAFGTCGNLSKVSLPEATTLGNGVFLKGYALTHTGEDGLYIPNVTTIGTYLFRSCTALTTVSMPKVTAIGTYTFDGCTSLTSVDLPLITSIPERAFQNCTSLPAFTNPSITSIGHLAFVNCSSLTAYDNSSVTSLGNNVFEGCKNLVSANLPNVTSMGTGVFHQCTALDFDQVVLSKMTRIPDYTFQSCTGITTVILPNDNMPLVTAIGAYAFRYDTGITSVTINTAMTLGSESFRDCTNNQSINAPLVTAIPNHTFYNNNKLTSINLPEVLTIGSNAFDYCKSLPTLSLPKVQSIDNYAFGTNSSLTEVSLPLCTTLATEVFGTCASLTKAYLPEVTTMGNRMFIYDTSLQTLGEEGIYLPKMTTIPPETFRECTNMVSAPLHSGITSIGNNAFYKNTNLESVTIPATVTSIGREAFRYCSSLNNVTLPGSLRLIEDWSFANCTSMENLTIEEGIPSINRDVFQYSGMKNVVLPSTIEAIGMNLFYQCNSLETLDLSKCMNVWELYNYTSLRGSNTISYGVPSTTTIILPPYTTATLGTNDEIATITFDLQQDSEGFYLINNTSDWDKFVVYSRQNPTINGRITADLDLTTHPGKLGVCNGESNYITYQGTLDGQGHTLTINYKTGKEFTGALIAYAENATVKNLHVKGSVDAYYKVVGGIVGIVKPSSTLIMQDCESCIDFTVTPNTTNMHVAGFIGHGKTGNITLTDCLFNGTITGVSSFLYAAPFLGWMESAGRITYNYCLNNGTFINTHQNYTYALGATQSSGQSTAAVCYFKAGNNTNNETLATATTAEQLASGQITYRLQGGRTEQHWGQLLGRDPYPQLTNEEGTLVYRGQTYTNEYVEYAGLQKDEDDYYLIGGAADWEEFCLVVEEFPLSNARMIADVEVMDNSIIGEATGDVGRYNGIFDGQGHTLTVSYPFTANRYSSPFANIEGATIKNLHVDGSINSAWAHGGGLVANSWGTNTLDNVWVSADIKSSVSGWDECGAFVGCMKNGTLNITNCLFTGSITASSNYNGGFIGYRDGGTSILTNCLSTGTFNYTGGGNDFTRGTTVTNCYYSGTFNGSANNITQVTDEQLASGQITYKLQGKQDDLIWAQTLGTDEQPMLALFAIDGLRVYRASIDSYTNDPNETILPVDADGYYQIASLDDWKTVSMLVADGEEEAKVRMIADIDLGDDQTRIGNPNALETTNYFKGIFDGQGHTLTIHLVQNGPQGYNTAPFPNISCATIKNIHFNGTITNDCNTQPSIVGNCRYGTSYLENIWSSVTTTSNSNSEWTEAAPFVSCVDGYKQGHLVMSDCLFTGAIQGTPTYAGAFIGYINPGGSARISNCLSTGTFQTGGSPGIRGDYTNCYVLQFTGSIPSNMQCTSTTLADGTITTALQADREEEIWVQDDSTGQPILALFKDDNGTVTRIRVTTENDNDTWFTLEGIKLDTKPNRPGVYIKNGKRVVIK